MALAGAQTFDAIVIGAGPAGEAFAGRLGTAGLDVALVEKGLVGGDCSYYACMPSKALLRPAGLLGELGRVPGLDADTVRLDPDRVLARRDEVIGGLDDNGQLGWLDEKGITLVRGEGRIEARLQVRVGERLLTARRAVAVATGSTAAMPPIPGLDTARPWTSREATTAPAVPDRLAVLGGGVVGVELGQAWHSLGAEVTILEAGPRLIAREEGFAGRLLADRLSADGITVRTGAAATGVERHDDGTVTVAVEGGGAVTADEILVATGRRPRSGGIGLEAFGFEPGKPVPVNDRMQAGTDTDGDEPAWLYALGDVNGRSLLTHTGKYQARVAADNVLGRDRVVAGPALGALAPRVVFTDPQVAAVGHTAASATEAGIAIDVVEHATDATPGASFHGRDSGGISRLVFSRDGGRLLGATFVGFETAEWLHAATIAVTAGLDARRLRDAVAAFPTRSEIWLRLEENYEAGKWV